jgi:alanyl-tRNA synthetase
MTSAEIRQSFLEFFKSKGHTIVPSSSLMPDSPNLLFTNAGMNQFVPIFLAQRAPDVTKWAGAIPGSDTRAADTQKCIRAGGKHNDLEDVGLDTYHHTFFEMLGNWSFGDYFKQEAIDWAWELVTEVWKFPKNRLYATVYSPDKSKGDPSEFDQDAYDVWAAKFLAAGLDPKVHIVNGNKKDNFWMMGETGPCGPCSELHVDLTPQGDTKGRLVNQGTAECIEIWNLVFIQFNANPDGTFSPLPAKHVDTGMGFERVTGILQNTKNFTDFNRVISNYETDIFRPIFDQIEKLSGKKYGSTLPTAGTVASTEQEKIDIAFRVIGDHIRTLSFAIADNIQPGNTDRNYVLRRILRRAVRYGRSLGFHEPFFYKLVAVLADKMGHVFPELRAKQDHIEQVIQREEAAFNKTLDKGIDLFEMFVSGMERARIKARDLEKGVRGARERISKLPDAKPTQSSRLARLKNEFDNEVQDILGLALAPIERLNADEESASVLFDPMYPVIKAVKPLWRLIRSAQQEADSDHGYNSLLRNYEDETVKAQAQLLKLANEPTVVSGLAAFTLYDTYGFPLDLTELMARERGLTVDVAGFNYRMEEQKARARASQKKQVIELSQVDTTTPTQFVGFDQLESPAKVLEVIGIKDKTAVILDTSPLYAEMGGQVGDTGELRAGGQLWSVANTQKSGNTWLHFLGADNLKLEALPDVGSTVTLFVHEDRRRAIERHHTVTHLLHWALHEVVSQDATQKGSYVGPEKLTFDFSSAPLTPQQVADVERLVNERILENAAVTWTEVGYGDVKARPEIMQFFGDKYGDRVRVVQVGGKAAGLDGYSMELCGGTHTRATGEIGLFRIVGESAIAAGIRRIEAVSGLEAYKRANEELQLIKAVAGKVNSPVGELEKKIEALLAQQKELEKQVKAMEQKQAAEIARGLVAKAHTFGSTRAIVENLGAADGDFLQSIADALKGQFKGVVVLGGAANNAVALVATVAPELTKTIQAGKIIQTIAPIVGGKGGGRPDNARGGGKDVSKLDEALAKAKSLLS